MSSEIMKKISGQLLDTQNNPLAQLPFGITVELTTTLSPPSGPGGWIGSSPVKPTGQFEVFTAYNMSAQEFVGYNIIKDGKPVIQGAVLVQNFIMNIILSDADAQKLMEACGQNTKQPLKVSGRVTNTNGKPVVGQAHIYSVSLRSRFEMAFVTTDANGYYEWTTASAPKSIQVEFIIPEASTPLKSEVFFNITDSIVADFVTDVTNAPDRILSEYKLLNDAISAVSGDTFQSLTVDDAHYLAGFTKENELLIKMFLLARSFGQQIGANTEVLYGIIRNTMQESLEVILNLPTEELTIALKTAVSLNVVNHFEDEFIQSQVSVLKNSGKQLILGAAGKPVADSKGTRILSTVLSGNNLNQFLDYYYKNDTASPDFWSNESIIAAVPGINAGTVNNVKTALSYALITGNNPAIVSALVGNTLDNNVAMTTAQWSDMISTRVNAADFIFPDAVTGDTTADKVASYAAVLKDNFEAAFKGTSLKKSIVSDTGNVFPNLKTNLTRLTTDNPAFDILNTPSSELSTYSGAYITSDFIEEVASVQRLNVVAPSFTAISALKQAGIASAKDVVQLSQDDFVANFSTAIGGSAAAAVAYNNAMNVVMTAQAVALNVYGSINLSIPAIYPVSPTGQSDWRSLFGTVDFCSCDNCLSVFSPSAYLVDSLELLRKYNLTAYNQLYARRPDLWNTKLTCKNTNTSLPYIDLVNEILEDMMKASGTNEASSPNPYYPINAAGYRDTQLDERTLNAIPEYIDNTTAPTAAYQKLLGAKYPWNAPYNYFYEQTKEYLGLINIAPYKLPQAFSSNPNTLTFQDIDLACSFLGITKLNATSGDYFIITDSTATNLRSYYGVTGTTIVNPADRSVFLSVPSGNLIVAVPNAFMNRVDILMQQSGLTITDVLELLDCYYINPITSAAGAPVTRRLKITGTPETTCDTAKMTISNLTENDLLAIHRFIRLQRKTAWSKYELDQVLTMLGVSASAAITDNTIIAIAQLKRLTEILNCSVIDVLPFWGDIGYMAYSKYGGDKPQAIVTQYENFFRNQAVVPNFSQITGYPFGVDMTAWKNSVAPLVAITKDQLNYLLAAFQIPERDFDTLFKFFNTPANNLTTVFSTVSGSFAFSYQNALRLLREFTFSKLLQISVSEWCILRSWMKTLSVDPFVTGGIAGLPAALLFIDKVSRLRNSGLTTDTLNYIFNDAFVSVADKNEKQKTLLSRFKELRALLVKLNTSVFPAATPTIVDAKALLTKIGLVLDPGDADFMVNYVANLTAPDNSVVAAFSSTEKTRFIGLLPQELTTAQKNTIALQLVGDPALTTLTMGSLTLANDRLKVVNDIYTLAVLKGQIRNYLSTTHKVDLAVSESLLSKWINVGGSTRAYDILLKESYINDPLEPDTTQTGTQQVLQILERFNKAALLVNLTNIAVSDLEFLEQNQTLLSIPDIANLPVGSLYGVAITPTPSIVSWINFVDWMDIRKKMSPSPTGIFTILQNIFSLTGSTPTTRKQTWFDSFIAAMQISDTDLEKLVGLRTNPALTGTLALDFNAGNPYLLPANYRRLLACLDLQAELEVNMSSCINITNSVSHALQQTDADFVVQSVKSRFTSNEWLDQAKPINDRLRTGRRDAMVAYLLAFPPNKYRKNWMSSNDIFETLLIDTEMMPIVKTSRIKQAISAVQLFVDRCVLQKEMIASTPITLTVDTIKQWNLWRKWYRIWEANRRIFVYPENWIEPDLRDDKSPFFTELEKFIKQNEINADTMSDAYRTYLERLDEVAHLDVVGYYSDPIYDGTTLTDTVVHVWGRTKSNPHIYYYRKRVMNMWNAWEKMDTQIDGNNFAPVKWRGRLRLYWLSLTEQVVEQISQIKVDEEAVPSKKYLKIELCWTELKNGKWIPKQVGKESIQTVPYGADRAVDMLFHYQYPNIYTPGTHHYTIKTFNDSFAGLKDSLVPYTRINADGDLEVIIHGRTKYISASNYNGAYAGQLNIGNVMWFAEEYYNNHFQYEEFKGRFTVKQNRIIGDTVNIPHTFFDTLVENFPYIPSESQYHYDRPKTEGYKHLVSNSSTSAVKLLGQAPAFANAPNQDKNLVFSRAIPSGNNGSYVSFPKFFYKDYHNAFFVEKISIGGAKAVLTGKVAVAAALGSANPTMLSGVKVVAAKGVATPSAVQFTGTAFSGTFTGTATATQTFALASTDYYRFYPFYHYKVNDIMERLDVKGLDSLFEWDFIQAMQQDNISFSSIYQPTASVMHYYPVSATDAAHDVYPKSKLDFSSDSPTAVYNWELFFHIPLLIANKLMQDQKFDEALKWYHYVFNPTNKTGTTQGNGPERFWQFTPFRNESLQGIPSIDQIMASPDLAGAIQRWANDPFKPHLVARTRTSAYMKNVLMKYLDNLMAWGDQLFRRDTMESINEASLLYILAAQILGKPPVKVPARFAASPKSYSDLILNPSNMNAFSNALVAVETVLAPTGVVQTYTPTLSSSVSTIPNMPYFCIPPNDKLLSYWDVVADRLFKIHNSQNIDGVERQLALFEPPIDPALLVRAAASGLSLSDAVNELFAPMPQYRFVVMQQKAAEMVQEVKSLGSSLLSAIEKKDAEHLSLIRSTQEISVMDSMREVKQYQLQEAQTQIAALQDQRDLVTIRKDYYNGLIERGLNANEQSQLGSIQASIPLKIAEGAAHTLAGVLHAIPDFKLASPFSLGATAGGTNLGSLTTAAANAIGIVSTVNDIHGSMAGIKGGYARRQEDWAQQLKSANGELKQIEKQLVAAEIRASIAKKEIQNQELQFNNAINLDAAMRDKYSNEDLYDWMISEISLTYFQSYKLAFDLAKRAERCYSFELGVNPTTPFIQFGYWNSLKKGLLAGEGLAYDIKRMDSSYLDLNKRQHELTKHVSLAALDSAALFDLKSGNKAMINIPEWLFDMDYPGHYFRRIKSVSISIPCVAGPYSTVSAKLTLNSSKYRKVATGGSTATAYKELGTPSGADTRFNYMVGGGQSIATSTAQNDAGMFEMNFKDERYLPFEGAGTVSSWTLELPSKYASFDRNSISDVIIHIQYTAKYDGGLITGANLYLDSLIADATTNGARLPRLFNLQREFSTEWNAYLNAIAGGDMNAVLSLPVQSSRFPMFSKGKAILIKDMLFKAIKTDTTDTTDIIIKKVPVTGSPTALTTLTNGSGPYQGLAQNVDITVDSQYQLKLSFGSSSATTAPLLLAKLKNLDTVWLAAIYSLT
jgi:hypothetical protein